MTNQIREQYLTNLLTMLHQAVIDIDSPVLLPSEENWLEISEFTKLPYPYRHVVKQAFEPTEEDLARLEEFSAYNNRPITKVEYY